MVMGCYGIGVTRIVAAAIEQNHDADGIVWPMALAPFQVTCSSRGQDEAERRRRPPRRSTTSSSARGIEVLYDDRDERAGVKFKDADLIGIPLRVTVGKKGLAEGKSRSSARSAARCGRSRSTTR